MEEFHLKVSLFQLGTDSSSWNHTRVAAAPVAAPDHRPVHRNNRRRVDSCNRDTQQAVRRVEQNATVPDTAMVQDSNSHLESARQVVCIRAFRVVLSAECPALKPVYPLVDEWLVFRLRARFPVLQPGCDSRHSVWSPHP